MPQLMDFWKSIWWAGSHAGFSDSGSGIFGELVRLLIQRGTFWAATQTPQTASRGQIEQQNSPSDLRLCFHWGANERAHKQRLLRHWLSYHMALVISVCSGPKAKHGSPVVLLTLHKSRQLFQSNPTPVHELIWSNLIWFPVDLWLLKLFKLLNHQKNICMCCLVPGVGFNLWL